MAKLPNNPLVSELFRAVHGAKTKDKKIDLLKAHKRDDVKALLIWNFDKGIDSAVPEGAVPYKPNESPKGTEGHTRLIHEWRTLYNFVRGGNVCLVKDKDLQSRYRITRNVVEEAYPEIVWRDR